MSCCPACLLMQKDVSFKGIGSSYFERKEGRKEGIDSNPSIAKTTQSLEIRDIIPKAKHVDANTATATHASVIGKLPKSKRERKGERERRRE